MADQPRTGRPDESASVSDADFTVESASASNAIEAPPDDTTADRAIASATEDATAEVVEQATEETETVEQPDPSQVSASRATAQAKPAGQQPKPKGKGKGSLERRTVDLKHEVDTLTHAKHRTRGELEADERRLADIRRQIAENEARLAGKPAPKADAQPAADAEPAMPEFPDYRKFATDDEYETAKAKYQTDLTAWHKTDRERLERRIAAGVESRFRGANSEAQFNASLDRLEVTRNKVMEGKPDWDEKREALRDIRSSWHDPARHGEDPTPFLTDIARTLLLQGNEEGAELLHWLGSDPDRAQALADLHPGALRTKDGQVVSPLRDAIVAAPSVLTLLDHFATDEGRAEFERLKQMHPLRMNQALGVLYARLAGASSGSPAPSHHITKAQPSARPPAGTPGARGNTGAPAGKQSFEDWMSAEDAKEQSARERLAGLAHR